MRFIAANCLREGMTLARPLFRGIDVMLTQGVTLNQSYIGSIQRCGFTGAYIDDELSRDIEITSMISDELRKKTLQDVRKIVDIAQAGGKRVRMPDVQMQVEHIIGELSDNRNIMVNMLDLCSYDSYTYSHSLNVAILSIILGMVMNLSTKDMVSLGTGALLHDIGKVFIDKSILQKKGKLTNEEFDVIKTHPRMGYDYIMSQYYFPVKHCRAILEHQEKYDGSGYPFKKAGDQISIYGRIAAVADVYDALTSKRCYRDALPANEAVEYIMGGSGSQFDPKVVKAFTQRIAPYPMGTSVQLSNGWKGLVVENYPSYCLRPKIRVYEQDGFAVTPFEISLKDDFEYLNITISGIG